MVWVRSRPSGLRSLGARAAWAWRGVLVLLQAWRPSAGGGFADSPCGSELQNWLYEGARWAPPGYHVVCVAPEGRERVQDDVASLRVEVWAGGHAGASPAVWSLRQGGGLAALRREVQRRAGMKKQKRWRIVPWALCSTSGAPVRSLGQASGVLLAFEGGRWVWPGIREGFERRVPVAMPHGATVTVTLRTLTLDPLAFTVEGFMNGTAAKRVIDFVKPRFTRSGVEVAGAGAATDMQQVRTCSEAWASPGENSYLQEVADLTASLTRVPRKLQEDFRMLEYRPGQQFVAHTDYYEVEDFKDHPQISQELQQGRNWLVTVYAYLSTVRRGGETYFPSSYGRPLPANLSRCEGPSVSPRRGSALLFYSLNPDSSPNLSSMHGGCKVLRGVKYTVNIWTFNQLKGLAEPDEEDRLPLERGDGAPRRHDL